MTLHRSISSLPLLGLFLLSACTCEKPEAAYVDLNELFEGFRMTDEMRSELSRADGSLDTLKGQGMSLKRYNSRKEQKIRRKEELAGKLSARIRDRLQGYIQEYGQRNDHDLIHGRDDGMGLVYGKSSVDLTDEVLEYANARYEGRKEAP